MLGGKLFGMSGAPPRAMHKTHSVFQPCQTHRDPLCCSTVAQAAGHIGYETLNTLLKRGQYGRWIFRALATLICQRA